MSVKYAAIRLAFEALAWTRLARLIRRGSKCCGVILTLHRVLPERPADFSPNAILQITPAFLEYAITRVRQLGFETVSLDEAIRRIESDGPEKPFVVFSFDDAYRDNLLYALPILRHLGCPFVLYVPTALVDGVGEVWWQALEDIVAAQKAIAVEDDGTIEYLDCASLAGKQRTYDALYARMRGMPEHARVDFIRELARRYGLDLDRQCRALIMDWQELQTFAAERLCTIGAHTVHHYELAKLSADEALNEIEQSISILKAQFGHPAAASELSDRRAGFGGAARIPDRQGTGAALGGDDPAGRALPCGPERPAVAAAHLSQRLFPGPALCRRVRHRRRVSRAFPVPEDWNLSAVKHAEPCRVTLLSNLS